MSVLWDGGVIRIGAPVRIEDAESLVALLQAGRARPVDLSAAGPLHTAVAQVLLAFRPPLAAPPTDPFTASWLLPLLGGTGHAAIVPGPADVAHRSPGHDLAEPEQP